MRLNEANENGDLFGRNSSDNQRSRRLLLFNRSGGNRRNSHGNMRKKAEQNQFCSAFLRLMGKNISLGWRHQWLNTGLDAIAEKWSILRNVTKTRYGDLARKFAPAIAAYSQAMTSRLLNLTVAGPVPSPAGCA